MKLDKRSAVRQLKALASSDDQEIAHQEADAILLQVIDDAEIGMAYLDIPKRYA